MCSWFVNEQLIDCYGFGPHIIFIRISWFFTYESSKEWPQELQAGFISNLNIFQLRINWRIASRAPRWIHIKFHHFSIKNQLKNCLESSWLDSYETWSCFQLRIDWKIASRAPSWIGVKSDHLFSQESIKTSRLDSYKMFALFD